MSFSIEEFDTLCVAVLSQLRRISRQTKGEYSVEELKNEMWLLISELLTKGTYDAILSPAFQKQILACLHNRVCRYTSKTLRYAAHFDDVYDDADDGSRPSLRLENLMASSETNPLEKLKQVEVEQEQKKRLQSSYSEATAYFQILNNFNGNQQAIAEYFTLSWGRIWDKIKRAMCWVERQLSLFDGIEMIDEHFMPPPYQWRKKKTLLHAECFLKKEEWRHRQQKLFPLAYIPIRQCRTN